MPLKIYPNPASSDLHIEGWFEEETRYHMFIDGYDGKHPESEQKSRPAVDYDQLFDVSRYASGIYWIKINIDGYVYISKVSGLCGQ